MSGFFLSLPHIPKTLPVEQRPSLGHLKAIGRGGTSRKV